MNEPFGETYSAAYDDFYSEKDYEAECDLIESQAARVVGNGPWRVLDLGCGTGGHALPLARRGHQVVGVDRSAAMLQRARAKARAAHHDVRFVESEIGNTDLGQLFDVALMMFAVLGYQTTNEAALAALTTARHHLRPEGVLLFDVWFGPAVLAQRPERRFQSFSTSSGEVLRSVNPSLDQASQICTVEYEIWRIDADRITDRSTERHAMRYFFPLELDLLLASTGFRFVHLGQGMAPLEAPDLSSWTVFGVAQAR